MFYKRDSNDSPRNWTHTTIYPQQVQQNRVYTLYDIPRRYHEKNLMHHIRE